MLRKHATCSALAFPAAQRHCAGFSIIGFLFFLAFLLMGCALFTFTFILPLWRMVKAQWWTPTECTILSSSVAEHSGGKDGSTYSVDVEFRYVYEGRTYTSKRYDAGLWVSSSGFESKAQAVARYPAGSQAMCYVNPRQPESAILNRGWPDGILAGLFPLIFASVGAVGLYFTFRAGRKAKETARLRQEYAGKLWMLRKDWAAGRVKSAERSLLIVLWGFAIVWNAISTPMVIFLPPAIARNGSKVFYLLV